MKKAFLSCLRGSRRYGDSHAPAIFLLHGFGANSSWWSRVVADLATTYQVYLIDVCFIHPPKEIARELLLWMQEQGIEHVTLAGHSLGSQIACFMAMQAPERVTALILVNPAFPQSEVSLWHWLKRCRAARRMSTDPPGRGPLFLVQMHPRTWRIVLHSLRCAEDRQQIDCMTLILWGTRDPLFPLCYASQFQQAFPHARLVFLNAGHALMYERSTEVCTSIRHFLQQEKEAIS